MVGRVLQSQDGAEEDDARECGELTGPPQPARLEYAVVCVLGEQHGI